MKARMKENLIIAYQQCDSFNYRNCKFNEGLLNEMQAIKDTHGWMEYFELKLFLKRIEGTVVDLVFTGKDAFEKNDNNYLLSDELWDFI